MAQTSVLLLLLRLLMIAGLWTSLPPHVYAGDPTEVCAKCHPAQSAAYPMSQAAETPSQSQTLTSHPNLSFASGRFSYQLTRDGDATKYTVRDGSDEVSLPVLWAFGRGRAEQTYILRIGNDILESRVSFYSALNGLDFTPGATEHPETLREAVGRVLGPESLAACFACHTTGAVDKLKVNFDQVRVGVRCDNCHEGAFQHAEAALRGDAAAAKIKSLKHLSAEQSLDFCGRCHRTSLQVLSLNLPAVKTIRFQPYRLGLSRCYQDNDPRIGCLACHNPHQPVAREAAAYDAKCLACHADGRPCPQAASKCTTCHMPRVEFSEAHQSFADHNIRVVHHRTASSGR